VVLFQFGKAGGILGAVLAMVGVVDGLSYGSRGWMTR